MLEILQRVAEESPKSLRQIAREVDLAHPTLSRILSGETENPHANTQRVLRQWIRGEAALLGLELTDAEWKKIRASYQDDFYHDRVAERSEEEYATTLILDPNTARRALGAVPADDVKTRVAIIREFEDAYIENGYPPERWPEWFHQLRKEVYRMI